MEIREYEPADREAVVQLSLRAWAPVFVSLEQAMDAEVFSHFYPDWRQEQRKAVEAVCDDEQSHVWVADENGRVVAFTAVYLRPESMGEIYMIAVDPEQQNGGLGTRLTDFAADWMRQQGMKVAMVETGGDPGHAPARRTYEKSGFRVLPVARYFKKL